MEALLGEESRSWLVQERIGLVLEEEDEGGGSWVFPSWALGEQLEAGDVLERKGRTMLCRQA